MPHFPKPFFKKARGLWYVEIDRKQTNLGSDREEAYRQYHQLMLQPSARPVSPTALVTIIDAFLDWVEKHRSPETFEWYRYRLQRFCERYPDLRIGELRPFHVQQWVDAHAGLSRTSKRNYIRTVKRCLKWATQQGYIDMNPIQHLEVPGADRREATLSPADYERVLAAIRDESLKDLVITTWLTGCRPQESLRVEARHVDAARQRWVFPKSESKGKRNPRIVYLTEAAWDITQRRMKQSPEGALFRNSQGKPWTTDAVNCAFERVRVRMFQASVVFSPQILDEAIAEALPQLKRTRVLGGQTIEKTATELRAEARRKSLARLASEAVPRFSLYTLRHSWATRALQSGLDGLTVAILLGHSDPSTLARVYQHLAHQPEHLLEQARKAVAG